MKSYALECILSSQKARAKLDRLLPGQQDPWLLKSGDEDAIAYFNATADEDGSDWHVPYVSADVSGRHHDQDTAVIFILRQLQSAVGGDIRNDDGELVRS